MTYLTYSKLHIRSIVDILAVKETWLDLSMPDALIHVPNFRVHRRDRQRDGKVFASMSATPFLLNLHLHVITKKPYSCK